MAKGLMVKLKRANVKLLVWVQHLVGHVPLRDTVPAP